MKRNHFVLLVIYGVAAGEGVGVVRTKTIGS
jgi:hypothetical protein